MALTFADIYNMIAFLTKSDASEGFKQIIYFLNAHVIKYALMVNLTIYVSCIKQFCTSVSIKKSNDVVRLQALMDRKKVIITKDSIRQALPLDDADSVDCLPNEEIFAELARMGYEKPSINSSIASAVIYLATAQDVEAAAEDEDVVNQVSDEPTSLSPTPATPPPPHQQEHIPSPPQAATAQSSPPPQQPPSHDAKISMTLLNQLLETCATLTKQVANLEQDKVAQAKEITKLKQRVKRLEKKRQFKSSGLKRLRKGRLDESQAKVYHLDFEHADKVLSMQESDEAEPVEVEEVIKVDTVAKLMTEVVTTATTITIVAPVPKASAPRKRRGVIIQDTEEAATASLSVQSDVKSKDKGKGILVEEPKPYKRQVRKNRMVYLKNMAGFKMDFFKGMTYIEIRPIFEKHFNSIWDFLEKGKKEIEEEESKRKSKNLKQKAAKKKKIDEETEELKTHLKIIPNDEDDVYNKATLLALKIPGMLREL
nr:hypothetical protein [Tanacetum cinerariifolium]